MRLIGLTLVALTSLALAGCENLPLVENLPFGENIPFRMEFGWTEQRALAYTWIKPRPEAPDSAYCYRTLAQPDCYHRPQPRQATRLVGYIGPEPL